MSNNLKQLSKDLKAFAKRCKDFRYTEQALLAFLLTGILAFSEIAGAPTTVAIKNQRQEINTSISDIHREFKKARTENDKLIKDYNLELIKLMEQGDHVVKSPWSSWQYAANGFYNDWQGRYKGRGDKEEKYPYEGIFKRSEDPYERNISLDSKKYSTLSNSFDSKSASSNRRELIKKYGIASTEPVREPIVAFDVNASIHPRNINKSAIVIASKTAITPEVPEAIKFTPPKPVISIPKDPYTPNPPTFAIVLGADCNEGCDSSVSTLRQTTKSSFLTSTDNGSKQNIDVILHYTWSNNTQSESAYAFKMYKESNTLTLPAPNDGGNIYYFNSYNFGGSKEFANGVVNSQGTERNHQRFFIGGSRFWEIDNLGGGTVAYSTANTITFPTSKTVNLGGIYTLALVSQGNGTTIENKGTITDKFENTEDYVINTPNSFIVETPKGQVTINKNSGGYLGYKVGIARVQENTGGTTQILANYGEIDFRGGYSIGMYTYLPTHTNSSALVNKQGSKILLSGESSYGMKTASKSDSNATMTNEGTIELRVNGSDKADNSAAMALMEDESVTNNVSMARGKAVNETTTGLIKLSGVQNSIGMFVNIDSDMTNKGKIKIDSTIAEAATDQPMNIAMRADYGTGHGGTATVGSNAEVINDTAGEITLKGTYAIGQLARVSTATNKGKILTDTDIKNSIGMSTLGGKLTNEGTITLTGSGVSKNIGVFLNSYTLNGTTYNPTGVLGANSAITVSGDSSTGILINGSASTATPATATLDYGGNVTVTGNGVSGMTIGDNNNGKAEVTVKNDGKVTVNNGVNPSDVYQYTSGTNTIKQGSYGIVVSKNSKLVSDGTHNVEVDVNVKEPESIGLYAGENAILEVGKHTVKADEGAVNYDADKGTIRLKGVGDATTGQKSLLFYLGDNGTGKVYIDGTMKAKIEGGANPNLRGTAFYYVGTGSSPFGATEIGNWAKNNFGDGTTSTLGHLTLDMEADSRLFIAQGVGMNLSDTTGDTVSTATGVHFTPTNEY